VIAAILVGIGAAFVISVAASFALLFSVRLPGQSVGAILRVIPEALRLTGALYRGRSLPRSVRWRLRIALIYNLQPINLIPDVVPVLGFADNVAVLVWALRSTIRVAGPAAVERHWNGSPDALEAIYRALRLSSVSTVRTSA
jgi:uncharacterized membrane protein YkvA (DUF1232 family)